MGKKQSWPTPMKVSDLIDVLEALQKEHGDLPVLMSDDSPVREVCAYDVEGNCSGTRIEIILHGHR